MTTTRHACLFHLSCHAPFLSLITKSITHNFVSCLLFSCFDLILPSIMNTKP